MIFISNKSNSGIKYTCRLVEKRVRHYHVTDSFPLKEANEVSLFFEQDCLIKSTVKLEVVFSRQFPHCLVRVFPWHIHEGEKQNFLDHG